MEGVPDCESGALHRYHLALKFPYPGHHPQILVHHQYLPVN